MIGYSSVPIIPRPTKSQSWTSDCQNLTSAAQQSTRRQQRNKTSNFNVHHRSQACGSLVHQRTFPGLREVLDLCYSAILSSSRNFVHNFKYHYFYKNRKTKQNMENESPYYAKNPLDRTNSEKEQRERRANHEKHLQDAQRAMLAAAGLTQAPKQHRQHIGFDRFAVVADLGRSNDSDNDTISAIRRTSGTFINAIRRTSDQTIQYRRMSSGSSIAYIEAPRSTSDVSTTSTTGLSFWGRKK